MTLKARDLMTTHVHTASPEDTIAKVARVLSENAISAMPVCDAQGHVVGLISEGDLMRPFAKSTEHRRSWWLARLAEGTDLSATFLEHVNPEQWRIGTLMNRDVVTATEATTLPALAELMMTHRVKRVPIVRDGILVGIVSRADIIRAVVTMPQDVPESA